MTRDTVQILRAVVVGLDAKPIKMNDRIVGAVVTVDDNAVKVFISSNALGVSVVVNRNGMFAGSLELGLHNVETARAKQPYTAVTDVAFRAASIVLGY